MKTNYVDGFVFPIATKNIAAYKRIATGAGKIWMKYGALDYKECIGDDLKPEHAVMLFPKLAGVKKGETVGFSYITYKSRKHRDEVNKKVMKDPLMQKMPTSMPFDEKRMAVGGFTVLVDGVAKVSKSKKKR